MTREELTYRELWQRSGWLSGALAERGVGRGSVVAIALERSVSLVVAFLGILRTGAAYLPLDAAAPTPRLDGMMRDADTDLIVCTSEARAGNDRQWKHLPSGMHLITVPTAGSAAPAPSGSTGDDPAYVAFTSGSTGRPKGVVVPHRAVRRLAVAPLFCTVGPGDRVGNAANPAFDATTFEIWNALIAGAAVVVLPTVADLPLDDWIDLIRRERINGLFLTTSLFHTLARERPAAFSSLDTLVVGGEQLELGAVRRVLAADPPARLVNGYGPTETTTFAAYFDCTPDSVQFIDRIPIGDPLQDTTLSILDDRLTPVPPGELGELCIGGPGVALGYLGLPQLTAEKFVEHPETTEVIYRTGDLARLLPTGRYEVMGRRDRQVKLRGFRIELAEIERAAIASGLLDAAFVEKVGDGPAAALVGFALPVSDPQPAGPVVGALQEVLRTRLPSYMLPARWVVLDRLPIGSTGKTDRGALLALLNPLDFTPTDPTQSNALTDDLAEIWRDVLGVPQVSPADNFLDLGGNSILAMQVAARMRERLGRSVEVAEILLADTLAALGTQVERVNSGGSADRAGAPQQG